MGEVFVRAVTKHTEPLYSPALLRLPGHRSSQALRGSLERDLLAGQHNISISQNHIVARSGPKNITRRIYIHVLYILRMIAVVAPSHQKIPFVVTEGSARCIHCIHSATLAAGDKTRHEGARGECTGSNQHGGARPYGISTRMTPHMYVFGQKCTSSPANFDEPSWTLGGLDI